MPDFDQSPAASREASPPPGDASPAALKPSSPPSSNSLRRLPDRPPASDAPPVVPRQQALALAPPGNGEARAGTTARQLWCAVHLPALALDVLRAAAAPDAAGARAVFEESQGMRRILLANRVAEKQGVLPGLPVNAALALVPSLELERREPSLEVQALQALAAWAERFTPKVVLEMPDGLLLEIAGSLGLFGGIEALRQCLASGLGERRLQAAVATAPTPLACLWLARSGVTATVMHRGELAGVLAPLPLDCLRWPAAVCESLKGMGAGSIGDCLRLPRQGFARRFGADRLSELDRALGRLADPRAAYRSPERFCGDCELAGEESDRGVLLAACRGLLEDLERFLTSRQLVVQHLEFGFFALQGVVTRFTLGCLKPDRAAAHWCELLEARFDRLTLSAAVIAIRLQSGPAQALQAATAALAFERTASGRPPPWPVTQLMERLAARIGEEGVHGVTVLPDHRPQYAWGPVPAVGERMAQCAMPQATPGCLPLRRPLWLLAEPLALAVEKAVPHYRGPLRFESGPERLETGWWDGHGIARDYFVAVDSDGIQLWIYRSRTGRGGWYLHGFFA